MIFDILSSLYNVAIALMLESMNQSDLQGKKKHFFYKEINGLWLISK